MKKIIFIIMFLVMIQVVFPFTIKDSNINWEYIQQNLSREYPVYNEDIIIIPDIISLENGSLIKGYNYTRQTFIRYDTIYYKKEKPNILEREGVKINGVEYKGWFSVCGDILVEHMVNPGVRNEEEYCLCQEYTKAKGVCKESKLI